MIRQILRSHRTGYRANASRMLSSRHLPSNVAIIRSDDTDSSADTRTTLDVEWRDGDMSSYHIPWLLANCPCRLCRHQSSGQRLMHESNDHLVPKHGDKQFPIASLNDESSIRIMFNPHHEAVFSTEFLRGLCYSKSTIDKESKNLSALTKKFQLPIIEYSGLETALAAQPENGNHKDILPFLSLLNENHICVIKDTPTKKGTVETIANLIGPVSHTIYGRTFDVVSVPNPINVAYSSEALAPHMDLAYYESPPGIQLLHCIRFDESVKGGESTFVDGHAAAEMLKQHYPEDFAVLTRVPATFQKDHFERAHPLRMYYQRPHINVNYRGDVTAVFWAPPFEGPLHVQPSDVEPYYRAREKFEKIFRSSELWENHGTVFKLEPGDLVVFNNRRMLHGRNAFTVPHVTDDRLVTKDPLAKPDVYLRHLEGAYVDIDTFLNKFRVLATRFGASPNFKQGWGIGVPSETRNGTTSHR